jgi:hypothetical protein
VHRLAILVNLCSLCWLSLKYKRIVSVRSPRSVTIECLPTDTRDDRRTSGTVGSLSEFALAQIISIPECQHQEVRFSLHQTGRSSGLELALN